MKVDVNLRTDEEKIMNPEETEVASGWVEIENCIKFPVKVRKYIDQEGQQKMFVSYPQRKNGVKYEGVVYPHDKEVRKEIEEKVLDAVQYEVVKDINLPAIEAVRVSPIRQTKTAAVVLRGVATIKIAGMTINGITIKEGQKGLFVQMPQYRSGGEYRDTVYGTNAGIHALIKDEVLKAYNEVIKEEKYQEEKVEQEQQTEKEQEQHEYQEQQVEKEEQVQETEKEQKEHIEAVTDVEKFVQAFEKDNMQEMLEVLSHAELEIANAKFTENWNAVRLQAATMGNEKYQVDVTFFNSWNPIQQTPPQDYLKQSIQARIFENGNCIGMPVLMERKSKSLENAGKDYNELLAEWKKLTKQEKIEIPQRSQNQEARTPPQNAAPGL